MANIQEDINQIATARYGREVRGSIVNALTLMNEESSEAIDKAVTAQDSATASAAEAKKYADEAKQGSTSLINESGTDLAIPTAEGGIRVNKIIGRSVKSDGKIHSSGSYGCVDLATVNWNWQSPIWYTTQIPAIKYGANNVIGNIHSEKYRTVLGRDISVSTQAIGLNPSNIVVNNGSSTEKPSGLLTYEIADGATPSQYALVVDEHGENLLNPTTIIIPLSEPLRSVGDIHDYIDVENKRIVRNVGSVDLGSLPFALSAGDTFHSTSIASIKMLCDSYEFVDLEIVTSNATANQNLQDKQFTYRHGTVDRIYFKDARFTDAVAFKDAVNGVVLNYELATPSIEPLTTEQIVAINSIKAFEGKTYITTLDIAKATLEVEYSASGIGSLAIGNESKINSVEQKLDDSEAAITQIKEKLEWKQIYDEVGKVVKTIDFSKYNEIALLFVTSDGVRFVCELPTRFILTDGLLTYVVCGGYTGAYNAYVHFVANKNTFNDFVIIKNGVDMSSTSKCIIFAR